MKKILSIAIALVMLLGIMPTVIAKEANTYRYSISSMIKMTHFISWTILIFPIKML